MKNKAIFIGVIAATIGGQCLALDLFGPKNFEDCILQGMKGVNNDTAANAVMYSCRQKFPSTPITPSIEMNNIGQRVCRVYWIGTGFAKDGKEKRRGFVQYSIVYETTQIEYIASIPEGMVSVLEKGRGGVDRQLPTLLVNNMSSVKDACNL